MQQFDDVYNEIFELKGVKRGVITIGGSIRGSHLFNTLYYEISTTLSQHRCKIIESEVAVNQIVDKNIDIGITRSAQIQTH